MMKTSFTDDKLRSEFAKVFSVLAIIVSLLITFVDFSQRIRIGIGIGLILACIIIYCAMYFFANKEKTKKLFINDTNINIIYGNLFEQVGIKVIAFNEYFDTIVDNKIISKASLNGLFMNNYSGGTEVINNCIDRNQSIKKNIVETNCTREYGGKTTKYRLGSIVPVDDYFLLAFTHFDDQNRAFLPVDEYIDCLMHMWDELDTLYGGRPLCIPLLGNGITRFNNTVIPPQELLQNILWTFRASRKKFNNTSSLTIVLDENNKSNTNLYKIGKE